MKKKLWIGLILLLICVGIPALASGSLSAVEIVNRMAESVPSIADVGGCVDEIRAEDARFIDGAVWTDDNAGTACTLEIYADADDAVAAMGSDWLTGQYVLRLSEDVDEASVSAYCAALAEVLGDADMPTQADYIVNTNTRKFHYPSCFSIPEMKDSNKLAHMGDRQALVDQGYKPCKRCNP